MKIVAVKVYSSMWHLPWQCDLVQVLYIYIYIYVYNIYIYSSATYICISHMLTTICIVYGYKTATFRIYYDMSNNDCDVDV